MNALKQAALRAAELNGIFGNWGKLVLRGAILETPTLTWGRIKDLARMDPKDIHAVVLLLPNFYHELARLAYNLPSELTQVYEQLTRIVYDPKFVAQYRSTWRKRQIRTGTTVVISQIPQWLRDLRLYLWLPYIKNVKYMGNNDFSYHYLERRVVDELEPVAVDSDTGEIIVNPMAMMVLIPFLMLGYVGVYTLCEVLYGRNELTSLQWGWLWQLFHSAYKPYTPHIAQQYPTSFYINILHYYFWETPIRYPTVKLNCKILPYLASDPFVQEHGFPIPAQFLYRMLAYDPAFGEIIKTIKPTWRYARPGGSVDLLQHIMLYAERFSLKDDAGLGRLTYALFVVYGFQPPEDKHWPVHWAALETAAKLLQTKFSTYTRSYIGNLSREGRADVLQAVVQALRYLDWLWRQYLVHTRCEVDRRTYDQNVADTFRQLARLLKHLTDKDLTSLYLRLRRLVPTLTKYYAAQLAELYG